MQPGQLQEQDLQDIHVGTTKHGSDRRMKLNLGCGDFPLEGWTNLDIEKRPGVDKVHDLNQGIPFPDNTFDEVLASHILEHLDDREKAVLELWRVCKPGARVVIKVPKWNTQLAWDDPSHKTAWTSRTILFFCGDYPHYNKKKYFSLEHQEIRKFDTGEEIIWELKVIK